MASSDPWEGRNQAGSRREFRGRQKPAPHPEAKPNGEGEDDEEGRGQARRRAEGPRSQAASFHTTSCLYLRQCA